MSDKKPTEKILLVYCGFRANSKNEAIDYWIAVSREQYEKGIVPENETRCYNAKSVKKSIGGTVGGVYEVEQEIGTTDIWANTATYIGLWPDQEQRTKWQIDTRLTQTDIDLEKRQKKEGAEDNFAVLMPFREKYRNLVSQNQRAALLAQMIAFVTAR